jgi:hypothetical protein
LTARSADGTKFSYDLRPPLLMVWVSPAPLRLILMF